MNLSKALNIALATSWLMTDHVHPFHLFGLPPRPKYRHAYTFGSGTTSAATTTVLSLLHAESSSSSSSPHPPDKPPPSEILQRQEAYFASPAASIGVEESDGETGAGAKDNETKEEIKAILDENPSDTISDGMETTPASSTEMTTNHTLYPTLAPVPAKPWMTPEQKEEFNAAANRFIEEVWSPLFASQIQSGVPADTIKGAALAGATLALFASKGLVVTSAAGLSAAYVAISQGVAGDVLRTIGGMAWDVTASATKLIQMVTADDRRSGLSKELVAQVVRAVQNAQDRAVALQLQQQQVDANVTEATEAFWESQEELSRVLEEAETAIGAADAAIAQADETLGMDDDVEAKLADEGAEARRLLLLAEEEARQAEEEALRLAAGARKAMKQAEEEAIRLAAAEAEAKQKKEVVAARLVEEEAKRLAAEAQRQAIEQARLAEEAKAMRLAAAEAEAKEKRALEEARLAEEEAMRLAASAEAERKAIEQARLAEEEKAAEAERLHLLRLEEERLAEEEAMRLVAEAVEEEQALLLREEEALLQEELRQAEEAVRRAEEAVRLAKESEQSTKVVDAADMDDDEIDDDAWLDAVAIAQQSMDGKIVGMEEAIQDELAKANWDAAGARARELSDDDDDDDDDDEDEFEMNMEELGRAARAAVERFESERGYVDDSVEDEDDDLFDDDLLPDGDLEEIAQAARNAVSVFAEKDVDDGEEYEYDDDIDEDFPSIGDLDQLARAPRESVSTSKIRDDDYESEEDDEGGSFQGVDGMMLTSTSKRDSSSNQAMFQRNWSEMTVQKLKDELRIRGLKTYGTKAKLILLLEDYERQQIKDGSSSSNLDEDDAEENEEDEDEVDFFQSTFASDDDDDDEFDLGKIDLEELGRQARAAVELGAIEDFDTDEPSDEVLMRLESEESMLLNPSFSGGGDDDDDDIIDGPRGIDYESMTVLDLKEALRSRGLRLSGKKAELIARLKENDGKS